MLKHKILLVDDDRDLALLTSVVLQERDFLVEICTTGKDALDRIHSKPDIILLDRTLPDMEGLDVCRQIREDKRYRGIPIMIVSGRDSSTDKIDGLYVGADDYLTKDISVDYLIIRIEALLRRFEALTGPESISPDHRTRPQSSALRIDDAVQALYWQQRKVELTLTQYWIVKTLADQPGQAKNAEQLMHAAHLCVEPNTISAHLKTIRERFRAIDPDFNCIKTERGIGYRWVEV